MKRILPIILIGFILASLSACNKTTETPQPSSTGSGYPAATFQGYPVPTAQGYPAPASQSTIGAYPVQNTGELFIITKPDKSTLSISAGTFNSIQKVTVDGHNGPGLADLINQLAGVTDFTKVTVTGSNGSKTLDKSQVTNDIILELDSNNKLSLVIKGVSSDQWITDVSQLVIE